MLFAYSMNALEALSPVLSIRNCDWIGPKSSWCGARCKGKTEVLKVRPEFSACRNLFFHSRSAQLQTQACECGRHLLRTCLGSRLGCRENAELFNENVAG